MKKISLFAGIILLISVTSWAAWVSVATLITPRTAAATANFEVAQGTSCSVVAEGLAGSEQITIKVLGSSYNDLYYSDDTVVVLTSTKNMVSFSAVGKYQVSKPSTASNVGVYRHY